MKYFFILFFLNALLVPPTFAQNKDEFSLIGSISGKDSGKIYLRYSYKYVAFKDSSIISNGTFSFHGKISEPSRAELSDDRKLFNDDYENHVPYFYLEPTEMTISLENSRFSKAIISGSHTNDDYKLFYDELTPVLENSIRLQNSTKIDSLAFYNIKAKEISFKFVRNHPNSSISVNAIGQLSMYDEIGSDSCLKLLNSLSDEIKSQHSYIKTKEGLLSKSTSTIGHLARDFTRKDVDGKTIKLSSFKGKYVLLDFWASWCAPCRALSPHLKNIQKEYASKGLELIAISCDTKFEDWHTAIKNDQISSFVNVLSFSENDMNFLKSHTNAGDASWDGELRKQFNLMPIPVEILIDVSGIIIGRYGATEKQSFEMLDKKLTEIFKMNVPPYSTINKSH